MEETRITSAAWGEEYGGCAPWFSDIACFGHCWAPGKGCTCYWKENNMTWTMMKHGFQMLISYLQCSCFIIFLQIVWWCVMLQQPLIWLDTRRCFICSPQGSMNSWNQSARRYQIWCSAPRQDTMFRFAGGKESDGNLLYFTFFSLRSRVCVGTRFWQFSKQRLFEQIFEPLDTWLVSFKLTSCALQEKKANGITNEAIRICTFLEAKWTEHSTSDSSWEIWRLLSRCLFCCCGKSSDHSSQWISFGIWGTKFKVQVYDRTVIW